MNKEEIEKAAEKIYNAFPYDEAGVKPLWQLGGNSEMQYRARGVARDILTNPTPSKSVEEIVEELESLTGEDYQTDYYPVSPDWLRTTLTTYTTARETAMEQRVGMLRQWLNEDRITDAGRVVSNEQLLYWLTGDDRYLPNQEKQWKK